VRLKYLMEKLGGSYVGVMLSSSTAHQLDNWMKQNLIDDATPVDKLHVTLIFDKHKPISHQPMNYNPPIVIDPSDYAIDTLGQDDNILVLKLKSDILDKRHHSLMNKYGLTWDFPEYIPHITLSSTPQAIKTELSTPDFPIELSGEILSAYNNDME